jgi:hypothetical protein
MIPLELMMRSKYPHKFGVSTDSISFCAAS